MKLTYYAGCTLKTYGEKLESSAVELLGAVGYEPVEIPRWNCCGTVNSLATDNVMAILAPARNLIFARNSGAEKLVTFCSMCYNTLKRVNEIMKTDKDKRQKVNWHFEELLGGKDYSGEVEVLHLLDIFKDHEIQKKLREKMKKSLEGWKVAPYYGCLLLRPHDIAVDDPEEPGILENLFKMLGAEVAVTPYRIECCGSYHTLAGAEIVDGCVEAIVTSAAKRGASSILTSCPLCFYNLDTRQEEIQKNKPAFRTLPVYYFTEVLAHALELKSGSLEGGRRRIAGGAVLAASVKK